MTTLDGRGDDRRTTLERLGPVALRVSLYWRVFAVNAHGTESTGGRQRARAL